MTTISLRDNIEKTLKPCERRELTEQVVEQERLSIVKTCRLICLSHSIWYYITKRDDYEVMGKLIEISEIISIRDLITISTESDHNALNGTGNTSFGCIDEGLATKEEEQKMSPGKPSQNGYIVRFNKTFKKDVLVVKKKKD